MSAPLANFPATGATEDRAATLQSLLNDAANKIGAQRQTISRQSEALEKIAGESPSREPSKYPTVGPHKGWSAELSEYLDDIIMQAFNEGSERACWELGQIADAALKATGETK